MALNVRRFGEWLKDLLVFAIPRYIDSAFRRLDYALNAAYHPTRKHLRLKGHGPAILLLMSLSFFFALYGPTWDALTVFLPESWGGDPASVGLLNVAMAIFLLAGVGFIWALPVLPHKGEYVRYAHVGLMLLVVLFILVLGSRDTPEAARTVYWHGFFLFGVVALGLAWALKRFAARLFRGFIKDHGNDLRTALANTELFVHPRKPRFHPNEIFNALISAPVFHPLPILLIPSLLVLFFREKEAMLFYGIAGLVFAWLLSFWGNLHPRWDNMMKMITRLFLVGAPLAVSLAVIAIAVARLMDVHYVTTIMDVTPMSVVPYILAAYVFLITFEYWANRSVGEILFPVFGTPTDYGLLEFSIYPARRRD
ncbi:MAG: hypothetical protein HUJ31_12910, partial [Pseudomonadales bacterium]|nr:hypothetical protein [Pseudomonadales bacterium]